MSLVRIYHPKLPGQASDVPESAVPHWSRSGWSTEKPDWVLEREKQELEEQAARERAEKKTKSEAKTEAPETSGASSLERSPRRRRHTEEGES